jgi:hypothetical protein
MSVEDTKTTKEISSSRELNLYLEAGWTLILGYVKHTHDTQEPRFVVAWQKEENPVRPEILDEWEKREIRRNKNR